MNFGDRGCTLFAAGTKLSANEVCKTGWCVPDADDLGQCQCPGQSKPSAQDQNVCVGNMEIEFKVTSEAETDEGAGTAVIRVGKLEYRSSEPGLLLVAVDGKSRQPMEGYSPKRYGLYERGNGMSSDIRALPEGTFVLLGVSGGNAVEPSTRTLVHKDAYCKPLIHAPVYTQTMTQDECESFAKQNSLSRFDYHADSSTCTIYYLAEGQQCFLAQGTNTYAIGDLGRFQKFDNAMKSALETLNIVGFDAGIRSKETLALIGQIGSNVMKKALLDRSGDGCTADTACQTSMPDPKVVGRNTPKFASPKWLTTSSVEHTVPPQQ